MEQRRVRRISGGGEEEVRGEFKPRICKYHGVWENNKGVVDEPEEDWLDIRLKADGLPKSKGVYD
jgi:hypothetical protein